MADRLRVVTISGDGRAPVVVRDIADLVTYAVERDSFQLTAPKGNGVTAPPGGRWGGTRTIAETHDNAGVSWNLLVVGGTSDDCIQKIANLLAAIDMLGPGHFLEWRPDGASYSTYRELRGPSTYSPTYKWAQFAGSQSMVVQVAFDVEPLGRGDQMDVWDDFSVDRMALDYTTDAGALGNVAVSGFLLTAIANLTTENRFAHTSRGYTHPDGQYTVKSAPGPTITSYKIGRYFKRISATTYLEVYVDDTGATSRLRIDKVVAGVRTNLLTTNTTARIASGIPLWVRGRIEGNVVTAEHYLAEPIAGATPSISLSYTLTTAEAAQFGIGIAGPAGLVWTPQSASAVVDDYHDEPYTYANRKLPDVFDVLGVPGDAPALMDSYITAAASAGAAFGAIAWDRKPPAHSLVWNGDFEGNTDGWSVAAVTNINGVATSITKDTSAAKYGMANGQVICPATSGTGASFPVYRRFKQGVTYTFTGWVRSAAQTTLISVRGGNAVANDVATSPTVALSTSWQQITVTWTPIADRDSAHIAFIIQAATATTFQIDAAQLYEGTVAPTVGRHSEGMGAQMPLGPIEAESFAWLGGAMFSAAADANARGGQVLNAPVPPAGIWGQWGQWAIDPSLLSADDFVDSVTLEFWARMTLPTTYQTPAVRLSAYGLSGAIAASGGGGGISTAIRYTNEYGSAGKALAVPTGGTTPVLVRLGTISFSVSDLRAMGRWLLSLELNLGTGSSGTATLDYLFFASALRRAASVSGKASVDVPLFSPGNGVNATKRVAPDGSGSSSDGALRSGWGPSASLGGALVEPGPGDVRVALLLSGNGDPDDPAPNTAINDGTVASKSASVHFAITPRYRFARGG